MTFELAPFFHWRDLIYYFLDQAIVFNGVSGHHHIPVDGVQVIVAFQNRKLSPIE